jgi:lipoprotein-anchoring transpeptidase ErfK/SrfK
LNLSRRTFLRAGTFAALSALAGCKTTAMRKPGDAGAAKVLAQVPELPDKMLMYAEMPDEQFPIPAIPYQQIDARFHRQVVDDPTGERPGTLVVDTGNHFLYLTLQGGKAMRYGVGLGRAGFAWAGRGVIQYKRKWPRWTPPDSMVARQPELERYSIANGGMDAGIKNPLGARALYIFQNGEDTLYRIHGSPDWHSIGRSTSSGCVRMINQDVVDLFERVRNKTPVIVTDLNQRRLEPAPVTVEIAHPEPETTLGLHAS